jgi:hypothetical protein
MGWGYWKKSSAFKPSKDWFNKKINRIA